MEKTKDSCSPMRVASQPEAIGPKIWPPTLKASMMPKYVPRAAALDPSVTSAITAKEVERDTAQPPRKDTAEDAPTMK